MKQSVGPELQPEEDFSDEEEAESEKSKEFSFLKQGSGSPEMNQGDDPAASLMISGYGAGMDKIPGYDDDDFGPEEKFEVMEEDKLKESSLLQSSYQIPDPIPDEDEEPNPEVIEKVQEPEDVSEKEEEPSEDEEEN